MKTPSTITRTLIRLTAPLMAASLLSQCTSSPVAKADAVIVSVKDQKLGIYENGQLKKQYKISTSKYGLGTAPGSFQTPLGKHQIVSKIGENLPAGAVLKGRSWNGEVLAPNAEGRDPVVSRILWLGGKESSNKNTYSRLIYIHGTPEERNLGRPASYGCIRMGMKDVISAFGQIPVGTSVDITEGSLSRRTTQVEMGEAN